MAVWSRRKLGLIICGGARVMARAYRQTRADQAPLAAMTSRLCERSRPQRGAMAAVRVTKKHRVRRLAALRKVSGQCGGQLFRARDMGRVGQQKLGNQRLDQRQSGQGA